MDLLCGNWDGVLAAAPDNADECAFDATVNDGTVDEKRFELFFLWRDRHNHEAMVGTCFGGFDPQVVGKREDAILDGLSVAAEDASIDRYRFDGLDDLAARHSLGFHANDYDSAFLCVGEPADRLCQGDLPAGAGEIMVLRLDVEPGAFPKANQEIRSAAEKKIHDRVTCDMTGYGSLSKGQTRIRE